MKQFCCCLTYASVSASGSVCGLSERLMEWKHVKISDLDNLKGWCCMHLVGSCFRPKQRAVSASLSNMQVLQSACVWTWSVYAYSEIGYLLEAGRLVTIYVRNLYHFCWSWYCLLYLYTFFVNRACVHFIVWVLCFNINYVLCI